MPKLLEDANNNPSVYMRTDNTERATTPAVTNNNNNNNSEGSSSPTSRSRSISSDDHGFGSASLSNISSSPHVEYACPRRRPHPTAPGRTYICRQPFRAARAGELELRARDLVEVYGVGDAGFWEGRCLASGREGWFKAACVDELQSGESETLLKRKTLLDLIQHCDPERGNLLISN